MDSGMLGQTKTVLKSLVISSPHGMTVKQLDHDYLESEGENIPYIQLGFRKLEYFLKSLNDTLKIDGYGPEARVTAILSEKTVHVDKLVRNQKKSSKSRERFKRPEKSSVSYMYTSPAVRSSQNVLSYPSNSVYLNNSNNYYNHQFSQTQNNYVNYSLNNPYTNIYYDYNRVIIPVCNNYLYRQNVPHSIRNNYLQAAQNINQYKTNSDGKTVEKAKPDVILDQKPNISFTTQSNNSLLEKAKPDVVLDQKPNISFTIQSNNNFLLEKAKPDVVLDRKPNISLTTPCNNNSLPESVKPDVVLDKKRNISVDSQSDNNSSLLRNNVRQQALQEALPEISHNDFIFLLDFPNDAVKFGEKILPSKLPDNIIPGEWFGLFVTEIHNPYKFWFHLYKENHELDELMQNIENFYTTLSTIEMQLHYSSARPGQVCAALFLNMWHRAEILEFPLNEKVKVFFIDYGTVADVDLKNIKYLLKEFSILNCQALRGSLAFIEPIAHRWSRDATYAFLDMVTELLLYAKAINIYSKERIVNMIIMDTSKETDFEINKALIKKGYAKLNKGQGERL